MGQTFRLSMAWLHTWLGLVIGYVLMVMFIFGTLSVFDREIDRWAMPATRFAAQPMPSFDAVLAPAFRRIVAPEPEEIERAKSLVDGPPPKEFPVLYWFARTTHRDPVLDLYAGFRVPGARDPDRTVYGHLTIDPRDGSVLPKSRLPLGTAFFYPMHISLHLDWLNLGTWIVGIAAMTMLAALVSGVVMHRKIFREFFTFRPARQLQRSVLDLHNLTGVVALPFLFFIAFSGLTIFAGIYFPTFDTMMKPLVEAQEAIEARKTGVAPRPSGVPDVRLASVDAMMARAQARWAERGVPGAVGEVVLMNVGDAAAYVGVERATTDRVATGEAMQFEASTGRLVHEEPQTPPVATVNGFLTGLHLQQFEHWWLRWLLFFGGLMGCVCIATGFVFFVGKRRRRHAEQGLGGARWADALAVTAVTGPLLAVTGMLVANRLVTEQAADADTWQKAVFWAIWALALLHATWRSAPVRRGLASPAWAEQCWALAALAVAAVVLNGVTTDEGLLRALAAHYWPVAGVDLVLLFTAAMAVFAARRLQRRMRPRPSPAEEMRDLDLLDLPGAGRA